MKMRLIRIIKADVFIVNKRNFTTPNKIQYNEIIVAKDVKSMITYNLL